MIKLYEIRKAYEDLSAEASKVSRQLCFAGIGLVWIYNQDSSSIKLPDDLQCPLLCFVLSLSFDIFQYFISAIIWYIIYLYKHNINKDENNTDIKDYECINVICWICWLAKIIFMVIAYYKIGIFILRKII